MDWYDKNSLNANPDKFQCTVHDKDIISTHEMNVLGVVFDNKLNFKSHVSNICKRASRQINALKRLSRFLNVDGRLRVYKSFILANFSYCPVAWLFCGKTNSGKLEKLQERALRFIYSDRESSYDNLLSRGNLLTLSMYRLRFLAIEVYKCVENKNPQYLNALFIKKNSHYELRDTDLIFQDRFNTMKYGYRSFTYYGAKLWNSLPSDIKKSQSIDIFKHKLNLWCRSNSAKLLDIC